MSKTQGVGNRLRAADPEPKANNSITMEPFSSSLLLFHNNKTIMLKYLLIFLGFLIVEILIAIFHFHPIIRNFVGDILVIPLIYYFLRIFFINISSERLVLYVLLFAFGIETLQYFQYADFLKIESKLLRTITGTTFEINDLAAYILGSIFVLLIDRLLKNAPIK